MGGRAVVAGAAGTELETEVGGKALGRAEVVVFRWWGRDLRPVDKDMRADVGVRGRGEGGTVEAAQVVGSQCGFAGGLDSTLVLSFLRIYFWSAL